MCGIIGIVTDENGKDKLYERLLHGLRMLEYRGYDSCGFAVIGEGMNVYKTVGRVPQLTALVEKSIYATVGIAHTRWATHGKVSARNTHPFSSMDGKFALVHNGIIENFAELKQSLIERGVSFASDVDSEVCVQLLADYYDGDTMCAIKRVASVISGTYAIAIVNNDERDRVYFLKRQNPLYIGRSRDGYSICSDIGAAEADEVCALADGSFGYITYDKVVIVGEKGAIVPEWRSVDRAVAPTCTGECMRAEMLEVPDVVVRAYREFRLDEMLPTFNRLFFVGCGTAFHAAMQAKLLWDSHSNVDCYAVCAGEIAAYSTKLSGALAVFISQSGETFDTLSAMRSAEDAGAFTIAVCNSPMSTMSFESELTLQTNAGKEYAVASTKAYNAQLVVLYRLVLRLLNDRGALKMFELFNAENRLLDVCNSANDVLSKRDIARKWAKSAYSRAVFFIGRGRDYVTAREGSLKLKEISYVFSEAYPSSELKHGTLALIEDNVTVVAVCTSKEYVASLVGAVQEVRARGATVYVLAAEDVAEEFIDLAESVITVKGGEFSSVTSVIPLCWYAYFVAKERGLEVDRPRNLAKSVTVS